MPADVHFFPILPITSKPSILPITSKPPTKSRPADVHFLPIYPITSTPPTKIAPPTPTSPPTASTFQAPSPIDIGTSTPTSAADVQGWLNSIFDTIKNAFTTAGESNTKAFNQYADDLKAWEDRIGQQLAESQMNSMTASNLQKSLTLFTRASPAGSASQKTNFSLLILFALAGVAFYFFTHKKVLA